MRALFERIVSPRSWDQLLSVQEQLDELGHSVRCEIERILLGSSYFSSAQISSGGASTPLLEQRTILDYGVGSPVALDGGPGLRQYAHRMERAILEYEPRLTNPRVTAVFEKGAGPTVEVRGTLTLGEHQSPFYFVHAGEEANHG